MFLLWNERYSFLKDWQWNPKPDVTRKDSIGYEQIVKRLLQVGELRDSARRGILTAKGVALPAEDETCGDVYYKNEGKQNEAGRPGLLMPIFIGRDGVFKDGVGERGCWLVPAGTPK